MDTRGVTHPIDCFLAGHNPYTVSCDPQQRLYNYPPIWLDLRYLGVTSRSSDLIGTVLASLMVAACLLLFRTKTWIGAAIIFLALTSRAVLLGIERGNTDQLIFSSLIFGFFLIDRQQAHLKSFLTSLLIVVLTILKIYPAVASIIFLRSRNGLVKTLLTAAASIAALLLTTGSNLPLLLANTPRDYMLSFGSFPFFLATAEAILPSSQSFFVLHRAAAPLGAIFLAALALAAVYLFRNRIDQFLPRLDFDHARGRLAVCGLAIFCFAFISGASYDYRLLFLLGPLAWLVEDMDSYPSRRSLIPAMLIVLLLWGPFKLTLIHEIPDGLVFVLAIAWLGTSLLPGASQPERAALPQLRTLQSS